MVVQLVSGVITYICAPTCRRDTCGRLVSNTNVKIYQICRMCVWWMPLQTDNSVNVDVAVL